MKYTEHDVHRSSYVTSSNHVFSDHLGIYIKFKLFGKDFDIYYQSLDATEKFVKTTIEKLNKNKLLNDGRSYYYNTSEVADSVVKAISRNRFPDIVILGELPEFKPGTIKFQEYPNKDGTDHRSLVPKDGIVFLLK